MRRVHPSPSTFAFEQQPEGHGQSGIAGTRSFGRPGTRFHRGESGLDSIGRAQMNPVGSRKVEESEQLFLVLNQIVGCFWIAVLKFHCETADFFYGRLPVWSAHDLVQLRFGSRLNPLGQLVQDIWVV